MDVSEQMPDSEVWQLIFAPGFSTADEVTDVSGRGVGMDVVKRNIAALNGSVEIDSARFARIRDVHPDDSYVDSLQSFSSYVTGLGKQAGQEGRACHSW